jgi:hypothetical protein
MKLIQLAVTAALVMSFGALQAQTVPNPPQKPQPTSIPPANKAASIAPVGPKATPATESYSGSSNLLYGRNANDHLTAGKGGGSSDAIVGERGDRAIKATPAAPPKSPSGIPAKSSPTQATSVDPPKVDPNAAPASSLGAIHRSNPVIVPPPQPNPTEQSYSRDQGFASQYGTRPDPRVSTTPGSGSSQPVPGRPQIAAQPRPHQGSPFKGSGGDDVLVTGASGGGRPGDAGKDFLSAGQKVTPAAPPKSQTGQQPGKR